LLRRRNAARIVDANHESVAVGRATAECNPNSCAELKLTLAHQVGSAMHTQTSRWRNASTSYHELACMSNRTAAEGQPVFSQHSPEGVFFRDPLLYHLWHPALVGTPVGSGFAKYSVYP